MRTFSFSRAGVLAVVGIASELASSHAAMAGPRDGVTVANQISDIASPSTSPGSGTLAITSTYTARYARLRGTLARVIPGTFAHEAMVRFFPPAQVVAPQQYSTSELTDFTESIAVDTFVRLSKPIPMVGGNAMVFILIEALDDGPGADSVWATLTVTLNDGPPTPASGLIADFGPISGALQYSSSTPAGTIRWLKFTLASGVSTGAGTYLDIDTEGSNVTAGGTLTNDTEIALYDEDGTLVGFDDDDGSNTLSQLTYGAGARAPVGNSLTYNGRDGTLPEGTYYLRVGGYTENFIPNVGWDFPNTGSPRAGTIHINIRTNAGTPTFCVPDFNRDGVLQVQDIFDYLGAWFAGCP